jgi:glycerol uptake facilitator-like aquaporin
VINPDGAAGAGSAAPGRGDLLIRKIAAEAFGTALLVFFGAGVATLMFGFGAASGNYAAGIAATEAEHLGSA